MTCHRLRDRLLAKESAADLTAHVDSCPDCARFAAFWEKVGEALGRQVDVHPPVAFAHRVVARLPAPLATPEDLLGRFAFRALPAAVLLALVLAWVGLEQAPLPATGLLAEEPSAEELLTYSVLAPEGVPVPAVPSVRAVKNVEAPR
jgi:hypothetical protein